MVEDEFYTVAQSFTRHLHYAEYVRRKKEAKVQNAGALEDIVLRPTDGVSSMSEGLKRKYQAEEISARQKAGIEQIEREKRALDESGLDGVDDKDAEEEQHESWAGTSLYDLMFSPRKARLLVGMRGVKSSTRAAAGFAKAGGGRSSSPLEREKREEALPEETTTDDEDDDLDGGGNVSPTVVYRRNGRPSTNSNTSSSSAGALISRSVENREKKLRPTNTERAGPNTVKSERRIIFDDFDELPELRKSNIQLQSQQFTPQPKTKRKHSKDNNTGAKKSRLNEVPTFLI
ncbi:hypothetical protein ARAM_001281 [Aspergillus rambellii]|uniref:Uncharacterized protein n=1 Tax=Aspergillus rambellii TaxID=308745 RepID=A0A0F8UP54_9EURO|nr:hypothetical protein ARAM_001281 [Aspergillus rambellii]